MRVSRALGFVAIGSLAIFSTFTAVQAQVYDSSANWLSTYPTTTSIASATSATWGTGHVWSAGQMSSNFSNLQSTPAYQGAGYEDLTTYYNANTVGYLNSSDSVVASYTYTVPFQTYQLNPGTTINLAVGQAMTEQVASGYKAYSGASNALSLPSALTTEGATSGLLREVAGVEQFHNSLGTAQAGIYGFDVAGYGTGSFKDGLTSIQGTPAGVFYDYNTTNQTSSGVGADNAPSSAGDALATGGSKYDTLTMNPTFGPSYVAWTAPASGTLNISMNVWDVGVNSGDGAPNFFVMSSTNGPTAPLFSALGEFSNGSVAGGPTAWSTANANVKDTQGTVGYLTALSGFTGNGDGTGGGFGASWASGNISVTTGEIIYFVADPFHTWTAGWYDHAYEGYQDPVALNDSLTFVATPEPSTAVLMTMAGAGLALVGLRRRRLAA